MSSVCKSVVCWRKSSVNNNAANGGVASGTAYARPNKAGSKTFETTRRTVCTTKHRLYNVPFSNLRKITAGAVRAHAQTFAKLDGSEEDSEKAREKI